MTTMSHRGQKYSRPYPQFSLCGLNCGLCPMYHISEESHCTGCGGEGRPTCEVIRCALGHENVEYCYQCSEYPCDRYREEEFDSFVPKRSREDFTYAKERGMDHYKAELEEKIEILRFLLNNYNDGRRKSFYCTAVNLLELDDIKTVLDQISEAVKPENTLKENAAAAAQMFKNMAGMRDISLKLRKKPGK